MALDHDQFSAILGRIDTLEAFGAVAVVAICATLLVVGYLGRFRK